MTSEKLRTSQNKMNSDDKDVVLACATITLVCAAKTEHLLKKKAKKKHVDEELAYGNRQKRSFFYFTAILLLLDSLQLQIFRRKTLNNNF